MYVVYNIQTQSATQCSLVILVVKKAYFSILCRRCTVLLRIQIDSPVENQNDLELDFKVFSLLILVV